MASLASMAARVARHASARSASLAARSGDTGEDLILGSRSTAAVRPESNLTGNASPMRPIQLFGCANHGARRPFHADSFHEDNSVADEQDKFVAEEEDMKSDEAMWALYQRWCIHFKVDRDHDDMLRRFNEFKNSVLEVHRVNKAGLSYRLATNESTDTSVSEKVGKKPLVSEAIYERFKAQGGGIFKKDGPCSDD